jgi:glutathione S-transferase
MVSRYKLRFLISFVTLRVAIIMASSTISPSSEFTILYHAGKFKGRGEFLRLMLEDAGQTYATNSDLYGPHGMADVFRGSLEAIDADIHQSQQPYPLLSVPALWHKPVNDPANEVLINQSGACMIYLGDALGYAPSSAAERARASMILLNCEDYISEGRRSFHPIHNNKSYRDQKEDGDRVSKEFSHGRMKIYLHHFNKIVTKHGSNHPVAGGSNVTYADFALFHVLDATIAQFNTPFYSMAWDHTNVPALKEYYAWFRSRPNLQEYFSSDRCLPYAGDSMM